MSTLEGLMDPLSINLERQIGLFIEIISQNSGSIPDTEASLSQLRTTTPTTILPLLSQLAADPSLTLLIELHFRPLLVDICARMLHDDLNILNKMTALSLLIQPHEQLYPVLSAFLRTKIGKDGPLSLASSLPELHQCLIAYYRILQACPNLPDDLSWPSEKLAALFLPVKHADNGVTLLAIQCYARQNRLSEALTEKLQTEALGQRAVIDAPINVGNQLVDGWLLPLKEVHRIVEARAMLANPPNYYDQAATPLLNSSYLSPYVVNVSGILLYRDIHPERKFTLPPTTLVSTPSSDKSLRDLALQLSLKFPTLVTAPSSSGKSLLLSHLASLIYPTSANHIITLALADTSIDPRSLLGSYISSTTTPGTFEWKDGVLVSAMRSGKWLVLDDIDRASGEVLGVLCPLVESLAVGKIIGARACLNVPGRPRVIAEDSFTIFATRSVEGNSSPKPSFFGASKFTEVVIPSPSRAELRMIIATRFPRLAGPVAHSAIYVWECIKSTGHEVGLRELEKWCSRLADTLPQSRSAPMDVDEEESVSPPLFHTFFPNPSLREELYVEGRDVFFGAGTTTAAARAHADAAAKIMAEHLGLDAERAVWVLNQRVPALEMEKGGDGRILAIRMGRTRLVAKVTKIEIDSGPRRPFALHRPSLLLLSRLFSCVSLREPVLLTGETGTGKTTVITHLAGLLNRRLISLNLSHQTESSDLLGGYKPIDTRIPAGSLLLAFTDLFSRTFSRKKNAKFEDVVRQAVNKRNWKRAVGLWYEATKMALERLNARVAEDEGQTDAPRKRRKLEGDHHVTEPEWNDFEKRVQDFDVLHVKGKGRLAFDFVEGPLVTAIREGHWVLLDEINLASGETLECITTLLQGPTASITLTEQGSLTPIPRHSDFRLFACMNPATDVGKKDLPPNIRCRFTEIAVPAPDSDQEALLSIIGQYISHVAVADMPAIMDVAEFYTAIRKLAEARTIADGSNHRPHFSMRTLARALTFAADVTPAFGLRRALWEGCLMAFTMTLDEKSATLVRPLAERHILRGVKNVRALLSQFPSQPASASPDNFIQVGPFWLERGGLELQTVEEYILTPSVETKLIDLARVVLTRRFPVLIEGPTSSGKTSTIEYLARRTGHRFVRINNHEHTDIQEYLGTYVSDLETGRLVFQDGILVRALRNGDWLVLDELNLAPTDVLEALNRLLDDNRELLIPETQEVVRPHPHFMLFATQNPPGLYAGRKVLSRAFRNRFLEVHFDDVPQDELEIILHRRCQIPESYAKRIVAVFQELQKRRQAGRVFESKHGFATLRDLFRWAGRDAVGYQQLAESGYMLLAERARRDDDRLVVQEVVEAIMKVKIDTNKIYDLFDSEVSQRLGCGLPSSTSITWTAAMKRLFVLICSALRCNEPVLLVGETGSGKTSVCELYAHALAKQLYTVNCHQNTETADLLGGQRPVRNRASAMSDGIQHARALLHSPALEGPANVDDFDHIIVEIDKEIADQSVGSEAKESLQQSKRRLQQAASLFEWKDGPLLLAMRDADILLLDEISLADDSVLERLNSVLEPSRTLVLAEKGGRDVEQVQITAQSGFQLLATMNPGGDYGKKELSPALRNRFTEIWVPQLIDRHDREAIVMAMWRHEALRSYTQLVLDFVDWVAETLQDHAILGLRDVLAWVNFANEVYSPDFESRSAASVFHHAAHMVVLDGLASLPQTSGYSPVALDSLRNRALSKLFELVPISNLDMQDIHDNHDLFSIGPFGIAKGPIDTSQSAFSLTAKTTRGNAMRILRACQVQKPILLEGSPGVGKTSLVAAIANITGHRLCRVNLSDQTDLMDLFGSDLPVEGGSAGEFVWKDAAFLRALQTGDWVLLDEMNLAPQAVLEGLNAVLDHRGTVYIPELGRSFTKHPQFRIFAAQNPLHQGGGRKGLPKSFLNRFTKVHVQELSPDDLLAICQGLFPDSPVNVLHRMITFTTRLNDQIMVQRLFGREGSPWEFNLRDILRWLALLQRPSGLELHRHPVEFLDTIFLQRFRSETDRRRAAALFKDAFEMSDVDFLTSSPPVPSITTRHTQIGHTLLTRNLHYQYTEPHTLLLQAHLRPLQALSKCLEMGWLVIVTGTSGSGKTSTVRHLAGLVGSSLYEFPMNNAMDTMDLLGSFEQCDPLSHLSTVAEEVATLTNHISLDSNPFADVTQVLALRKLLARPASIVPSQELYQLLQRVLALVPPCPEQLRLIDIINAFPAATSSSGRFDWVDGPLVRAVKNGHWLLLDNANLCNPSVLDRLNALCETDGVLSLNERGLVDGEVQVLRPHPAFRLIMTLDPRNGELSRAMRNRGIELFIQSAEGEEDAQRLADHTRLVVNTTTQGSSMAYSLCAESETLRRGLASNHVATSNSTGAALRALAGKDSPLASLSIAIERLPNQVTLTSAYQTFLSQTTSPVSTPLLQRYLLGISPWKHLLISDLLANPLVQLVHSRACKLLESHGISLTFLQSQSLDLALVPHFTEAPADGTAPPTFMMSLVIELFVRTNLLNRAQSTSANSGTWNELSVLQKSKQIVAGVPIVAAIPPGLPKIAPLLDIILERLEDMLTNTEQSHLEESILLVAVRLIGYAEYFSKISSGIHFDFSAVRTIATWFLEPQFNITQTFAPMAAVARSLLEAVALKQGHGMVEIWQTLLPTPTRGDLDGVLKSENSSTRWNSFHLLALAGLTAVSDDDIGKLTSVLPKETQDYRNARAIVGGASTLAIIELQLLAMLYDTTGSLPEIIHLGESFLHLASQFRYYPLDHLVHIQRANWAIEAAQCLPPEPRLVFASHTEWLKQLWTLDFPDQSIAGPASMLRPIALLQALMKCHWKGRTLNSVPDFENELNLERQAVLWQLSCRPVPRQQELVCLLLRTVVALCGCFESSYPPDLRADLNEQTFLGQLSESTLTNFFHQLGTTSNPHLQHALAHIIEPTFRKLGQPYDVKSSIQHLGMCWIALARALLHLYLPDIPVDPAAMQRCRITFLRTEQLHLEDLLGHHLRREEATTGGESNPTLLKLQARFLDVQNGLEALPIPDVTRPGDVPRLHALFAEVTQFCDQIIPPSKLDVVIQELFRGQLVGQDKEQMIQASIEAFLQRIDTAYSDHLDITHPFTAALHQIRLGLRLVAEFSHDTDKLVSGISNSIVQSLVTSPTIIGITSLGQVKSMELGASPHRGVTVTQLLLLKLSSIAYEFAIGIERTSRAPLITDVYDQLISLHLLDRARQDREARESTSLYRSAKIDEGVLAEAEQEEQEFLQLFPQFQDILDDDWAPPLDMASKAPSDNHIRPDQVLDLFAFHFIFMEASNDPEWHRNRFQLQRQSVVQSAVISQGRHLTGDLDVLSTTYRLSVLEGQLRGLRVSGGVKSGRYNFYNDPNVPQVTRAVSLLVDLRNRLDALVQEWPEQMVLQHLRAKCEAATSLELVSSVAKMLSALEQLLLLMDSWETFANKDNSLKQYQYAISTLVIEWRRLELSCWSQLLDSQADDFSDGVATWWFRIYESAIAGTLASSVEDSASGTPPIEAHMAQLVPLLEEFITSSPLGQFATRLRLLRSFHSYARYLTLPSDNVTQQHAISQVRNVLGTIVAFYEQLETVVGSALAAKRKVVEDDIRNFIKLASWKDINVHALKQSAQKTHRQLHKAIRKFRDILRQPVAPLLGILPSAVPKPRVEPIHARLHLQRPHPSVFPSLPTTPSHLTDIVRTFHRFEAFLSAQSTLSFVVASSTPHIEILATSIIQAVEEFSKETGASKPGVEGKHDANLQTRKRRAWADLLKELRGIGLTSNMQPAVLERQQNRSWIFQRPRLPLLPDDPQVYHLLKRADTYFLKLAFSLPALRNSLNSHHQEISARELKRATGFVESSYSYALESHAWLCECTDTFAQLEKDFQRLSMVITSDPSTHIFVTGDQVTLHFAIAIDTTTKLIDAIEEVLRFVASLHGSDSGMYSPSLVHQLEAQVVALRPPLAELLVITGLCKLTKIPVLLRGEHEKLLEASRRIQACRRILSEWVSPVNKVTHILAPIVNWLDGLEDPIAMYTGTSTLASRKACEDTIDVLLVVTQRIVTRANDHLEASEQFEDKYLRQDAVHMKTLSNLVALPELATQIQRLVTHLAPHPCPVTPSLIEHVVMFLDRYLQLGRNFVLEGARFDKAMFKLTHVLCSTAHTVAIQGFCKPQDDAGTDADGTEATDLVQGTGLGVGTGKDNVSNEIEDESQVEGLQDEDPAPSQDRDSGDDQNAIEMSEDFTGNLEDAPAGDGKDEDSDGEDDSQPDAEDKVENLDPLDPQAVDEKIWGDESGPESGPDHTETTEDRSKEQTGDSELAAKAQDKRPQKHEQTEAEKAEEATKEDLEPEVEMSEQGEQETGEDTEEPSTAGAKLDEYVPEANTLDLPDDLDLGNQDQETNKGADADDLGSDVMDESDETPPDESDIPMEIDDRSPEKQPTDTDNDGLKVADETEQDQQPDDSADDNNALSKPDMGAGGDGQDQSGLNKEPDSVDDRDGTGETTQGGAAQGATESDERNVPVDENDPPFDQMDPSAGATTGLGQTETFAPQGDTGHSERMDSIPNPLRSLGDAMKEIQRRFNEIANASANASAPTSFDRSAVSEVEHLQPGEEDLEMQALGPAEDDQIAKLKELTIAEPDDSTQHSFIPPALDERNPVPPPENHVLQPPVTLPLSGDIEAALTPADIRQHLQQGAQLSTEGDQPSGPAQPTDQPEDQVVEAQLRQWQNFDQPEGGAAGIWKLYSSLTQDLSYALCEQLRLILEPTLATRLKGDYRTGKRLNMKKIIPYIASEFTKDKIWLRRTRPSQREYQVLLALDDSKSMAESHSIHLAYQALALVSKALNRLEVGDIAIVRFGETVDLLHGFDSGPFSDEAGANVMKMFHFDQTATDVLALIQTSLRVLGDAREKRSSSSASDLWQLHIIISDGMCQSHDKLHALLRRAEEQRVMIVFVIIDALHQAGGGGPSSSQNSILSMKQAGYKMVDGQMQLSVDRYLDTFPFEYFVILRSVEALPEVLSATLKQFFERISED